MTKPGQPVVNLAYDPLGRLWQVWSTAGVTQFVYDGDALVLEYDGSGNLLDRYVHGASAAADDPLIWYAGATASSATRHWLHSDHLGSIVAIANGSGGGATVNSYDEYGIPASTNSGRFQYTGQAWIPEIGMYYYKARIYSPTLGRFLQTDPIGYGDGPNWYAYTHNDPVNGADPSGTFMGASTFGDGSDQHMIGAPPPPLLNELNAPVDNVSDPFDEAQLDAQEASIAAALAELSQMSAATGISVDCLRTCSAAVLSFLAGSGGLNGYGYQPAAGDTFLLTDLIFAAAAPNSAAAKIGVGWATVNRVGYPGYPDTLAGVIFQPGQFPEPNGNQWTLAQTPWSLTDGNAQAYDQSEIIADEILSGRIPDPTGGAISFYSGPNSGKRMFSGPAVVTRQIDGFTFLRPGR